MSILPPSSPHMSAASVLPPGQLYHMARAFHDGARSFTPAQSLENMLRGGCIQGQATKGYFARPAGVKAVSFTKTGIEGLGRLVARRSEFGICFDREFIDPFGTEIRPVHYLERGAIEAIVRDGVYPPGLTYADRNWIDLEEAGVYCFSWENEWRKLGDLFFEPYSIAFIIAPIDQISAGLMALGYDVIPSEAIRDPGPHMKKIAELVADAKGLAPAGVRLDEAEIEAGYLTRLASAYSEELFQDFFPKSRSEMRHEEVMELFTESGELRDPDGEHNLFEAAMFDLENMLDETFEDSD